MKKLIALLLATIMCLGFVACGDKDKPETTTTTEVTTTTDPNATADPNAPATTIDPNAPTTTTDPNAPTTTTDPNAPTTTTDPNAPTTTTDPNAPTTTTDPNKPVAPVVAKVNGLTPPVNGSVADIVAFYNASANATKSSPKVKLEKYDTLNIAAEKLFTDNKTIMGWLGGLIEDLNKDRQKFTETFVNGKGTESTGRTIKNFIPVTDQDYMSRLKPEYVQSASCVQKGSGWEIKISLKEETAGILSPAPQHGSCMDTLEMVLNPNDLPKELTVEDGAVATYSVPNKSQFGGKGEDYSVYAVVNPNGKLDAYKNYEPVRLVGRASVKLSILPKFGGDLILVGYFKTEVDFHW